MIRKVPNMYAWIGKSKDLMNDLIINTFISRSIGYQSLHRLPILDTCPEFTRYYDNNEDDLLLLVLNDNRGVELTLEQVEQINKTWNKFYESKDKET